MDRVAEVSGNLQIHAKELKGNRQIQKSRHKRKTFQGPETSGHRDGIHGLDCQKIKPLPRGYLTLIAGKVWADA
jgi:hypothetical protein